ncbi:MAG: recombination-associated protein RdgC, partial [Limnohabitans sp.]
MFKNVMVYRIGESWSPSLGDVESALQDERFVECGATQDKSVGWSEPRGQAHGPLVESVGGQWIAKLVIESKVVPGNVVRRKLDEQVAEIESATGRKPGKKEKRNLQDDALLELLPQAFAKQATVLVWINLPQRRLVLDCG